MILTSQGIEPVRVLLSPLRFWDERSSRLGLTWGNTARAEGRPQVKRALTTLSGGRGSGSAGWGRSLRAVVRLAVPAGVVLGDGEAELFEVGDELADAAVVVEPGAIVGELLVGQDAGGGLAVFFPAGPLVVGAVSLRGVSVAVAAGVAAAGQPVGEGAGQGEGEAGEAGGDLGGDGCGLGLLGRGGRHAVIVAGCRDGVAGAFHGA